MKNLKRLLKLVIIFCMGFICGLFYVLSLGKRYDDTKIGEKMKKTHNRWGKPDITSSDTDKIYDRHSILFITEYVFKYKKQDSTLINKWKEN